MTSTVGVIVGATGGIGGACLDGLEGAADLIVAVGRDPARTAGLERPGVAVVAADVGSSEGRDAVASAITQSGMALSWVVLASGEPLRGPFSSASADDISRVFASNLVGPVLLMQALSSLWWSPNGTIVVIGSTSAARPIRDRAVYAASKAGLELFAHVLAAEWAARGINVNIVSPGIVETPFLGGASEHLARWARENVPAMRTGQPHEVAHVVRYLIVERPPYVTGARLTVDGGLEWRS